MEQKIRKSECGIYFISDVHIGHKNILKHQPNRIPYVEAYAKEHNIDDLTIAHDEWLIDLLLSTTKRNDHVYVLGDFIMKNQEESRKILHRLKSKGCKYHLVTGNHDKSIQHMYNMFDSIDLIKVINFKKTHMPLITEENFQCVCCHYPITSWFNKCRGSLMLFGHVHENAPWLEETYDLMFNVGFDSTLSSMGLIPLEEIYEKYKEKLNGIEPKDYANWASEKDPKFVR